MEQVEKTERHPVILHRCEFVYGEIDRMLEDSEQCRRLAWHYYAPWQQWFCSYHRRGMRGTHGMRSSGWRRGIAIFTTKNRTN